MGRQQSGPINGLNPLQYQGNTPNLVTYNRRPTVQDGFSWPIGMQWVVPKDDNFITGEVWYLVSKAESINTWKRLGGGAPSGVESLTGNTGGPVDPLDGNINIVGDGNVVVTGNPATNTLTISASGGSGFIQSINKVYLTTPGSGTYTAPANLIQAYVECIGGGGGGYASYGASSGTTGGSAGGYCAKMFTAAVIGASQSYSVGGGGAGGAATNINPGNPGSAGGNTTFGSFMTANGGGAGTGYNTINPGGGATGGDINIQGGTGTAGVGISDGLGYYATNSGNGGSSMYGQGGAGSWSNSSGYAPVGNSGTGYGSGPAGNFGVNESGARIGGSNGQPGIIIITEYIG